MTTTPYVGAGVGADFVDDVANRNSYAVPMRRGNGASRIPTAEGPCMTPHRQRVPMLDLVFLGGGVLLFCLLIAYERLCNRL